MPHWECMSRKGVGSQGSSESVKSCSLGTSEGSAAVLGLLWFTDLGAGGEARRAGRRSSLGGPTCSSHFPLSFLVFFFLVVGSDDDIYGYNKSNGKGKAPRARHCRESRVGG
jgi:hypothetical protein